MTFESGDLSHDGTRTFSFLLRKGKLKLRKDALVRRLRDLIF